MSNRQGTVATAKEQYDVLLSAAAYLMKAGHQDRETGHASFWTQLSERTRVSLVCSSFGVPPTPDYFESRRPSLAEIQAVQKAYSEFEQAIWRRAAEILRKEAVGLKAELKRERDELTELVNALEGETT